MFQLHNQINENYSSITDCTQTCCANKFIAINKIKIYFFFAIESEWSKLTRIIISSEDNFFFWENQFPKTCLKAT